MNGQAYEQLTLFQGDSPASRLASPGSDEARMMTVSSGQRCLELSKKSGPLGSLVKMLLGSSAWRSTVCFLTWKAQATPHRRLLYRLAPSQLRTDAIESQLWPTVRAAEHGDYQYSQGRHDHPTPMLTGAVKMRMIPTAVAGDACGTTGGNMRTSLRNYVRQNPRMSVPAATSLIGTPTTYMSKRSSRFREGRAANPAELAGGQLNPMWVEWLMGFPIGWTELSASETP